MATGVYNYSSRELDYRIKDVERELQKLKEMQYYQDCNQVYYNTYYPYLPPIQYKLADIPKTQTPTSSPNTETAMQVTNTTLAVKSLLHNGYQYDLVDLKNGTYHLKGFYDDKSAKPTVVLSKDTMKALYKMLGEVLIEGK